MLQEGLDALGSYTPREVNVTDHHLSKAGFPVLQRGQVNGVLQQYCT